MAFLPWKTPRIDRQRYTAPKSQNKASEVALASIGIKLNTDEKFDESLKESKTLNAFLNRTPVARTSGLTSCSGSGP